jgi:hypothetical protein
MTCKIAQDFVAFKKTYGLESEQLVYASQNISQFLVRLITQRPLAFYGHLDVTLLRDHIFPGSASDQWDPVGTDHEGKDITMRNYIYITLIPSQRCNIPLDYIYIYIYIYI